MDMLVPIMLVGGVLGFCLFVLIGAWKLLTRAYRRGWRACLPTDFSAWNAFWFTPRDPTVLGLIRICCGAITTYTVFAYTFMLQDFMGTHAWYDLNTRLTFLRTRAITIGPLSGRNYPSAVPTNDKERAYVERYKQRWGVPPPPPFPATPQEEEDLNIFKERFHYDLRYDGLAPPKTKEEREYIPRYMLHPANTLRRPPPAYPASAKEEQAIFDYMATHDGLDPRLAYAIGQPSFSIWFHVTDPQAMMVIHCLIVFVTFLFTIGFCTRITSVLTWMTSLWYIHRDYIQLFGVDTMMMILLLYLMLGPSGAALSVDRLIARWWFRSKPRVVNRWRALMRLPALAANSLQPAAYSANPLPTVSANFAIRMLQIHLCIIYFISGVTKLQGAPWWNGTAVWGTLANFEFAPMPFTINHVQLYNDFLRWLGGYDLFLNTFLTGACWFTLAFEIGYAFLIWRPRTRWLFLAGAITLHGFIGLLMGLKTFSLMMLVMNMGFLRRDEVDKFLRLFRFSSKPGSERLEAAGKATPIPALSGAGSAK